MKKILFSIALFCSFFAYACTDKDEPTPDPTPDPLVPFDMERGVNISSWLSQSTKFGNDREKYFTEAEVKNLSEFGFDHLRLPVDEEHLFTESGEKIPEAFKLLHNAISWCEKYNMRIIVDLHILRSHHFNEGEVPLLWRDKEAQYKYLDLWDKLSGELNKYSNELVAYELLNEPVAPYASQWNSLAGQVIRDIRKKEPERKLIVGSNLWQQVGTFNDLIVPMGDNNIILSFHFYHPHLFTHYKAEWSELSGLNVPIHYPGEIITAADYEKLSATDKQLVDQYMGSYDKEKLAALVQLAIDRADELGLQLHCGEFGCYNKTPQEDRLRWVEDVVSIFRDNGIAYSFWEYKEGFGFCYTDGKVKDQKMLDILTK